MKSIKFIRAMIFMLTVSCLLVALMGFGGAEKTNGGTSESTSASESSEIKEKDMSEKEDLIEKMKKDFKGETVSFTAEPYTNPGISWEYSLDVIIIDGNIYINDTLYEESLSAPPPIVYSEGFLVEASVVDRNNNQGLSDTLQKIQNSDSCYLIETDQKCKTGKIISIYEIEGVYYFVRFYDNGNVMRIHYAPIE